jgi:NADPH2:quinone reductase
MNAIRVSAFGPPDLLRLCEVRPPDPKPGEILVRVAAAGVNPVDTYIRSGAYGTLPELPYTPGLDGAGTIELLGSPCAGLVAGQRVYLSGSLTGTYAQFALCATSQVHPLPENLSFAQGAALGIPYATADYALRIRAGAQPGETLLIHGGTGAVGTALIQIAQNLGLCVFATGGTAEGCALLRSMGVEAVFNHSDPGYESGLRAAKEGKGFQVILEMLANLNLPRDLQLLAPGGRVVIVGSRGPVEINPRDLMSRNADVRGMMLFGVSPGELQDVHARLYRGASEGWLRPRIAAELPLAQAPEAHRRILKRGLNGKLVLLPWAP